MVEARKPGAEPRSGFTIVGEGPGTPGIERVAQTAAEAEREMHALIRMCGKFGRVAVWRAGGRAISPEKLASLVRAEQALSQPGGPPANPLLDQ